MSDVVVEDSVWEAVAVAEDPVSDTVLLESDVVVEEGVLESVVFVDDMLAIVDPAEVEGETLVDVGACVVLCSSGSVRTKLELGGLKLENVLTKFLCLNISTT